jgi:hypothetical protein
MSDVIGRVTVPAVTPSNTFPLVSRWPYGRAQARTVIVHQFGSANSKIEQRFLTGDGAIRFLFKDPALKEARRRALRDFYDANQGTFTYNVPKEDGTFEAHTCYFENAPLSFDHLISACSAGVTLVDVPDPAAAPVYTLNGTVTRFPGSTLNPALLAQEHEIIPLIKIRVLDGAVPDIFLSDRRVTIGSQLYLPRLLRIGDPNSAALITQSTDGSTDDAQFSLGNADRVMVQVANDTQLLWARVELSFFHVGTGIKLDLWAGYIIDWASDAGPEFTVKCSDVLSALTRSSPVSLVSRTCWRRLGLDNCPWNPSVDTRDLVHFPSALTTVCDLGYNTPNGCLAHGPAVTTPAYGATYCSPQGVMLRSGGIGFQPNWAMAFGLLGGITSVSTWYPRTSLIADSIYGQNLPEIWHNDDGTPQYALPVSCKIAAGRDEDQFYAALGIVGKGPLGAFTAPQMWDANGDGIPDTFIGSTLDGSPNHGYQTTTAGILKLNPDGSFRTALQAAFGLRQVLGTDPAGAHDYFSLGRVSATGVGWFQQPSDNAWMEEVAYADSAYNLVFSAGLAFCEIRRVKPNNDPLTTPGQHTMVATVSKGLTGLAWTAPGSRTTIPGCTNPFWVAVNTLLSAVGMAAPAVASSTQELYFDVGAAVAAAAIANVVDTKIIGTGTELQFRFKGSIDDRKPTRDWLQAILNAGTGYYVWSSGKLKVGCRSDASAVSAFTAGNILFNSLRLAPILPKFEKLTVSFQDQEFQFQQNTIDLTDQDHAARNNRSQNPLASTFALAGCSTKSQAGRIAIVRSREELGGVGQAEQDAARAMSLKTTILALETEAGMVVSVADADLPGGTGKFRIQRWAMNRDWSIDIQGQTVTDSMYDMTFVGGPKPADVAPAPIPVEPPRDADVPDAPTFGVEISALDPTVAEVAGIAFAYLNSNTNTINGATFTYYYSDATAPDYLLSANLTTGALSVSLASAPATLSAGDYATIGEEIVLCGTPSGTTLPITRAQLGSTAATAIIGDALLKVFKRVSTVPLPLGFFLTPEAADWVYMQPLPDMKLVAVTGYMTNAYGDGLVGTVCLTGNSDHGLRLDAPVPGAIIFRAVNPPANTDTVLTPGNQIVSVVATTRVVLITLPAESADVGDTVWVKWAAGSTFDVHLVLGSGDTADGSSATIVLNAANPVWGGIGA